MKSRGLIAFTRWCNTYSSDRVKYEEVHPYPYFLYTMLHTFNNLYL